MNAPLSVQAIRYVRAGRMLLDDVSFDLASGSAVGIVGPSGAGKSTLALALMQLLPRAATMGARSEVLLNGEALHRADPHALRRLRGRRMAMIFQEPALALDPAGAQLRPVRRRDDRDGAGGVQAAGKGAGKAFGHVLDDGDGGRVRGQHRQHAQQRLGRVEDPALVPVLELHPQGVLYGRGERAGGRKRCCPTGGAPRHDGRRVAGPHARGRAAFAISTMGIDATANAPVSWLIPTLTNPVLRSTS